MWTQMIEMLGKYGNVFVEGLIGTLWLSATSVIGATILGTIFALLRMTRNRIIGIIISVYMAIIRGTPVLLQLYFFWLLLPRVVPFEMSEASSILVALIINASAYVVEVVRAGIQSVDIGQIEAAKSLGLRSRYRFFKIILPQAIKTILPALGNQYIMMVKQTSLASVFFVPELMTSYRTVQAATFLPLPALMIAGIIYFVVTAILSKGLQIMERRMNRNEIRTTLAN
jgi:amine acid ABC transporter, permease protein, 3-TM region, His/Glu/Gln/Arg/opine family